MKILAGIVIGIAIGIIIIRWGINRAVMSGLGW